MFNRLKSLFGGNKSEQDAKYRPAAEKLNASTKTQPIQLETHADILETLTALKDGAIQGQIFKKKAYVDYKDPTHVAYALQMERQVLRGNRDIKHIIPLGDSKVLGDGWQPTQQELKDFLKTFMEDLDPADIQRIHLGKNIKNLTEPLRLILVDLQQKGWVKDRHGILKQPIVQNASKTAPASNEKNAAKLNKLQGMLDKAKETGKKFKVQLATNIPANQRALYDEMYAILSRADNEGFFIVESGPAIFMDLNKQRIPEEPALDTGSQVSGFNVSASALDKVQDLASRTDRHRLDQQQEFEKMGKMMDELLEAQRKEFVKAMQAAMSYAGVKVDPGYVKDFIDSKLPPLPHYTRQLN